MGVLLDESSHLTWISYVIIGSLLLIDPIGEVVGDASGASLGNQFFGFSVALVFFVQAAETWLRTSSNSGSSLSRYLWWGKVSLKVLAAGLFLIYILPLLIEQLSG